MKKLFFLLALASAACFSCKKECEKDETGNVRFVNLGNANASINLGFPFNTDKVNLSPGESTTVGVDIVYVDPNTGIKTEPGWFTSLSVAWAGGQITTETVTPEVCETVEIQISN